MTIHEEIHQLVDLHGRVACVTGAAQGIGRAAAERLAQAGAQVVLTDLKEAELAATVQALQSAGGAVDAFVADAGSVDAAQVATQYAVDRFGRLDILVNNAAVFTSASVLEITRAEWRRILDVDLDGAFFHSQAAAKHMVSGGRGGRIITIASQSHLIPPMNVSAYVTAKGGVVAMTRALARELGTFGITANVISPGTIVTPGSEEQRARMRAIGSYSAEGTPARSVLGRAGDASDVANAVLFLASDLASYVTGQILAVDGGYALL